MDWFHIKNWLHFRQGQNKKVFSNKELRSSELFMVQLINMGKALRETKWTDKER